MILGIDASTYLEELAHGAEYYDEQGRRIDPLDAFLQQGVDFMRIRLWNDPRSESGEAYLAGTCDLKHYLALGRLAKDKGFRLLLDFHYSDFWADPAKQMIPKAWQGLGLEEMEQAVYTFTRRCLREAVNADLAPELIQVGNEITNGFLWPLGRLEQDGVRGNYDNFCRLLKAGIRACREICPASKLILHLERSNDRAVYGEFFTQMAAHGVDYDIIGASYYPYWHGTPEELFANLDDCRRFGKERMVMELGYGFTDRGYSLHGEPCRLVIEGERAYVPGFTERYPVTPRGQAEFIRDFLKGAREHELSGVFYWEPLWLPGEGIAWASPAGQDYIGESGKSTANEWANQCLFDYDGKMLPGFSEYK